MEPHPHSAVLLVEDEPTIADSVMYALQTEGFQPVHANCLAAARRHLDSQPFAAILLDVTLPDGSGFDFCRELIRSPRGALPVLFLTARDSEVDRILGLELGRGDYMTKPFSPRELTVRLRNLIAARKTVGTGSPPPFDALVPPRAESARLHVDRDNGSALLDGYDLGVSASECRILAALVEARGRVLSRDRLLDSISDHEGGALDRVIDSHIKNLRKKFREIEPGLEPIRTKRGFGYALATELIESGQ